MTPKQTLATVLAAAAVAVVVAACDTRDDYGDDGYGAGYGGGCHQLASCEACTPVLGCGWCSLSSGKGACVSDPDECARSTAFYFTWEPSGCRSPADAGVVVGDSGPGTPTDSSVVVIGDGPISTPVDAAFPVVDAAPDAGATPDTGAE